MTTPHLVLIANAGDSTITVFELRAGSLVPLSVASLPGACSTFAIDPDRDLVYAAVKGNPPAVLTLKLDRPTGSLENVGTTPIPEALAYLSLAPGGTVLLGAAYHAGKGWTRTIGDDGIGDPVSQIAFANLHCVITSADGRFAYFVSLGEDLVAQFELSESGELSPLDPPTVSIPQGSGPRHLIIDESGENAYLQTEFSAQAIRLRRDPGSGQLTLGEAVSIADPSAELGRSVFGADPLANHYVWGADLHLAGERWLICSERNASTLATVKIGPGGSLKQVVNLVVTQPQPRGFAVSPDGGLVVAVGERGTDASVYRVQEDGRLTLAGEAPTGKGANWVRFA